MRRVWHTFIEVDLNMLNIDTQAEKLIKQINPG